MVFFSSLDSCLHCETVFTEAAGVPYGQGQESCLGTAESRVLQLCTPPVWLRWGYPHHLSNENQGRLVRRAESTTGVICIGGQVLVVKRWQSARLALHLQSSRQESTAWFSLLSEIIIHQRISIFLYWFVPKCIVAWKRRLPYYTANKKCDLIQYYSRCKTVGDSDPTLPCYSIEVIIIGCVLKKKSSWYFLPWIAWSLPIYNTCLIAVLLTSITVPSSGIVEWFVHVHWLDVTLTYKKMKYDISCSLLHLGPGVKWLQNQKQ